MDPAATPTTVGTTPEGILLGADAPTPPDTKADTPQAAAPEAKYTEAEMIAARTEEKDKLYSRLESVKSEVDKLKSERESQFQQEAEKAQQQKDIDLLAQEEDMDVRQLLEKRETEWESKFQNLQQEQQRDRALLDRERQFAEVTAYQSRRVEEERENIMPELIDLVSGSTPEEIEDSIGSLKQRSERIFNSAQEAISTAQHDSVGSRITMPVGMENPQENASITPEAIRNMSLQEYAKKRQALLSNQAQGKTQGLFG